MQAITDFISAIGAGIQTAIDFLGGLIADLVSMAVMLADGLAVVPTWLGYFFPEEIVLAIVAILAIVVIYKIVGREG